MTAERSNYVSQFNGEAFSTPEGSHQIREGD